MRKDVYLVSKNSRGHAIGDAAVKVHETHLDASLERLKTDYVDCYYIHGISGREIGKLRDPGVKAAFENLKKLGKIRFCGLSCHDGRLPEILDRAAEVGWIDQVMIQYTFRFIRAVYPWIAHRPASSNQPMMSWGVTCFSASPMAS
jgi:predicted aldo/keto reductase-like oxidoreductase